MRKSVQAYRILEPSKQVMSYHTSLYRVFRRVPAKKSKATFSKIAPFYFVKSDPAREPAR